MLFLVIQPCFSIAHSKAQCETFILLNHDNVDARRNWVKQQYSRNLALVRKNPGFFISLVTSIAYAPLGILVFSSHMFTASNYQFAFCSNLKLFFFCTESHKFITHAGEVHRMIYTSPISIHEFSVTYLINLMLFNMFYQTFDFKDFMETYLLIWAGTHTDIRELMSLNYL